MVTCQGPHIACLWAGVSGELAAPRDAPSAADNLPVHTLILWDSDGTLVMGGPVGARVFSQAIERVIGRRPARQVILSGKTDPQIALEYLRELDVAEPERHVPRILEHLASEHPAAEAMLLDGVVLPGVPEVLRRLSETPGVVQTVLTGNIRPNADLKLRAFGLDSYIDMDIGAYGSDHADRNELVPIALAKVRHKLNWDVKPEGTWVVGDTPHDLACARVGGARCLLVATGRTPMAELESLGPDALLPDLSNVDAVITLLVADVSDRRGTRM